MDEYYKDCEQKLIVCERDFSSILHWDSVREGFVAKFGIQDPNVFEITVKHIESTDPEAPQLTEEAKEILEEIIESDKAIKYLGEFTLILRNMHTLEEYSKNSVLTFTDKTSKLSWIKRLSEPHGWLEETYTDPFLEPVKDTIIPLNKIYNVEIYFPFDINTRILRGHNPFLYPSNLSCNGKKIVVNIKNYNIEIFNSVSGNTYNKYI